MLALSKQVTALSSDYSEYSEYSDYSALPDWAIVRQLIIYYLQFNIYS